MTPMTDAQDDAGHALVLYRGNGLDDAGVWAHMPPDARRRRALTAATTRDVATLVSLTEGWLRLHGRRKGQTSPLTLSAYRQGITALVATWPATDLLKATSSDASLWLESLRGRTGAAAKASTLIRHRAAARALYAALRWTGATARDPFADARVATDPTPADEKRKPYTSAAVGRLVACSAGDDRVLVLLGAHAGLRVAEALALRWDAIDLDGATLTVLSGKGGRRRTVTLSASLVAALRDLSRYGERVVGERAGYVLPYRTTLTARRRLEALCTRASVAYLGMHSLRHSAGTRLYAETKDLDTTARHLGHKSIETTRIYAKWSDETLKATLGGW